MSLSTSPPSSPPFDFTLWATRPSHQNSRWQARLAELGPVHAVPLMAIDAVCDEGDIQQIKNRILDLDHYHHVIFVSQNAVHHAFEWIEQYWPQLPVAVGFYAVGDKTAAAARHYGVDAAACGQAMNSEALLGLPALQAVRGDKVLICRGKGGRPKLAEVLADRGATVDYCELYERTLPKKATEKVDALLKHHRLKGNRQQPHAPQHIIPLFSGETLQNLLALLPEGTDRSYINVIVPAQHAGHIAQQAGLSKVWVAQNASEEAMLATVQDSIRALASTPSDDTL